MPEQASIKEREMTREDLQPWCYDDPEYRQGMISTPYSQDGYTIATNGHVLIRIPRMNDVARNGGPDIVPLFENAPEPETYFPVPEPQPPTIRECTACFGKKVCPECENEGTIEIHSRGRWYEVECRSCNGHGKFVSCDECDSTGEIVTWGRSKVGSQSFSDKYLTLLKTLPGVEIGPTYDLKPARFRFDGGDGLIMPMNV